MPNSEIMTSERTSTSACTCASCKSRSENWVLPFLEGTSSSHYSLGWLKHYLEMSGQNPKDPRTRLAGATLDAMGEWAAVFKEMVGDALRKWYAEAEEKEGEK